MRGWPAVQHHRLGLTRLTWLTWLATGRGAWALLSLTPLVAVPGEAAGGFAARAPSFTVTVTAATFSESVSPTPTVSRRGQNLWIQWPAITISSGRPVTYTVRSHTPSQPTETVCALTDASPAGTLLECRDFKPAAGPTYTVQAHVTGPDGDVTWLLPQSSTTGTG